MKITLPALIVIAAILGFAAIASSFVGWALRYGRH
jgi:hypothetical protein